jgi:hypothetical protein
MAILDLISRVYLASLRYTRAYIACHVVSYHVPGFLKGRLMWISSNICFMYISITGIGQNIIYHMVHYIYI